MKKISSLLVFGLALLLSCEKEGPTTVNEITDLYTAPAGAKEMTFTGGESTWSTDRRYFDLKFSDLTTTLVGYDAFLAPGLYMLGGDEIGKAIAAKTKVGGQTPSEGWITVNNRDGKYQFTAQFGDQVYFWTGTLPFQADPDPLALTVLQQAQANKDNKLVTMQLATEGISQEFDMTTYQNVWKGEGKYLALDLYSEDGYLHDGTYTASAEGGVVNPGEFGRGWDPGDLYNIGMVFTDWGTCLWTVSGGAATAEKITAGLVNVTSREEKVDDKDVTIWTIYWGEEFPKELIFEGAIPALTKPKKPSGPVNPDYLYTETITPNGEGVENHAFDITDKNNTLRAHIELLMAAGETDYDGAYPSTSYSSEPGQMVDGWAWGDFGGGSYWINDSGEKVLLAAGQYTMNVTKIAEGAYNFTCELFNYDAAGPDFVPGGSEETLPAKDVVSEQGAGVDKHSITIGEGDNIVAYFELLTATGADFVGSFVSTEYAAEPGMLCNGYSFPDWGIFGGSYIMVDGARQDVAPGATVEVTNVSGSVYKFVCSTGETFVADVTK